MRFWLSQRPKAEANLAFHNQGDFRFVNRAAQWGLDHEGVSFGAALAEAQEVIKIGSIYPLTGAIASSGMRSKHAVETRWM